MEHSLTYVNSLVWYFLQGQYALDLRGERRRIIAIEIAFKSAKHVVATGWNVSYWYKMTGKFDMGGIQLRSLSSLWNSWGRTKTRSATSVPGNYIIYTVLHTTVAIIMQC